MVPLCNLSRLKAPERLQNLRTSSGEPDVGEIKNIIFYQHSLKLSEILAKVVSVFYDDSHAAEGNDAGPLIADDRKLLKAPALIRRIETGDFQELIKLEASLDEWERELPAWLQFPNLDAFNAPQKLDMQTVTLRTRYVVKAKRIILLIFRLAFCMAESWCSGRC